MPPPLCFHEALHRAARTASGRFQISLGSRVEGLGFRVEGLGFSTTLG